MVIEGKFAEAISKASQGDNEAFLDVCKIKGKDILYVCIRLMNNNQDGEDVAKEVIRRMKMTIHELDDPQKFNVWLYRIIKDVCEMWQERRQCFVYRVLDPID